MRAGAQPVKAGASPNSVVISHGSPRAVAATDERAVESPREAFRERDRPERPPLTGKPAFLAAFALAIARALAACAADARTTLSTPRPRYSRCSCRCRDSRRY